MTDLFPQIVFGCISVLLICLTLFSVGCMVALILSFFRSSK